MGIALVYGYKCSSYLEWTLKGISCLLSKAIASNSFHIRALDLLVMGFWQSLKYLKWTSSCEAGIKSKQKAVSHPDSRLAIPFPMVISWLTSWYYLFFFWLVQTDPTLQILRFSVYLSSLKHFHPFMPPSFFSIIFFNTLLFYAMFLSLSWASL